ncbi:MAG: HAD family hydrolase, partial [Candidatus Sungbacteria bacterium]|nr:HAD family hydrolase [Candidatus Sungbacteria bacterium]
SKYIYRDVPDFLAFLEKEGIRAVLLSTGDAQFQKQKINKSGITDLFDDIIIISDSSKVSALDTLIRKKKPASTIFIDDKKEVVEEVKKSLPEVYTIQMRRRETQVLARGVDLEIKDFSQSVEFITNWHRENRSS